MIQIRNIQTNETQQVVPTIFPDKTSQVWKLDLKDYVDVIIEWYFEEEAELIWVMQLKALLDVEGIIVQQLFIPFLPYGRQDKEVSNTATFARKTFIDILTPAFTLMATVDSHSPNDNIISYSPKQYIEKAIEDSGAEVLVFPDKGAYERYSHMFPQFTCIVLDKVRDQLTGNITGLSFSPLTTMINWPREEDHYKFLIVDDLCDGGMTYIKTAEYLNEFYYCDIALYVTHGIFSKGRGVLHDANIQQIYTTQSIGKNAFNYELNNTL